MSKIEGRCTACGALVWEGALPTYFEHIVCVCGQDNSRDPGFRWRLRHWWRSFGLYLRMFRWNVPRALYRAQWHLPRELTAKAGLKPGEELWDGYDQAEIDAQVLPYEERMAKIREIARTL